ncbi:MAG TPA: hypothetical protein VGX37_07660 [Allosphingosinicella sp.]|jgi:hypothetical protein|nr:hypothetical protein [Allosphingosinicella sp.]
MITNYDNMAIVLIHWRIKPEDKHVQTFIDDWKTKFTVKDRSGLVAEFVTESLDRTHFPYITWDLSGGDTGSFRSFVTVGLWQDADQFREQIAAYFNDKNPPLDYEQQRRRRVVLRPLLWRLGGAALPNYDFPGVK